MKIWVILENSRCREDLCCEHGLSLYIESGDKKILFDAGQSSAFAENAEKMGVDLKTVDFFVLSHGHYDHGGGLETFLSVNSHAPVYIHREAFAPCYDGKDQYIGLDPALQRSNRLVFCRGTREICPGITLTDGNDLPRFDPVDSAGLTRKQNGGYLPDDFSHEQYLLIREGEKTVCISGCSHKGIGNIVRWFTPDVLVGGFHYMKRDPITDAPFLREAAQKLMDGNTLYYTGHCTGDGPYDFLKTIMDHRLHRLSTGTIFEIR